MSDDEHLHMGMAAVADALQKARIEVEGYRKDAERYRWLRSNLASMSGYPFICYFRGSFCQWTGEHADMAVDEAMQSESEPQDGEL